nr:F0F1 ATP synthase subunit delta [Jannaschia seohaensis]
MDVSEPASISTGIAERYAQAVFELSREGDGLSKLEQDVADLGAAIGESEDLREVLTSPVISRAEQGAAITAVAEKMGLSETMRNVLALMASKRRLFVVPAMVRVLRDRLSDEKGEVLAEIRSATQLSDDQRGRLAEALKSSTGKDVKLDVTVDEALIGGLVVKVGSQMIDTSIRAKLNALQNTMKEVR